MKKRVWEVADTTKIWGCPTQSKKIKRMPEKRDSHQGARLRSMA